MLWRRISIMGHATEDRERERELARQVINSVVSVRPSVYAYVSLLIVERLTFLCVYGSLITTGRRPGPVQFSSDHVT